MCMTFFETRYSKSNNVENKQYNNSNISNIVIYTQVKGPSHCAAIGVPEEAPLVLRNVYKGDQRAACAASCLGDVWVAC